MKTRPTLLYILFLLALPVFHDGVSAQQMAQTEELKKLSLEDLLSLQVTIAGRKPEPLWRTAGAVDVITSERIRRSGATTIPDLLRLAAGLHVIRSDGQT